MTFKFGMILLAYDSSYNSVNAIVALKEIKTKRANGKGSMIQKKMHDFCNTVINPRQVHWHIDFNSSSLHLKDLAVLKCSKPYGYTFHIRKWTYLFQNIF